MSLEQDLKKYLPEAQQGNIVLDEFLEASGKHLDALRASIDNFKTYNDYETIDADRLEVFGAQFGIEFPRNLLDDKKRHLIKDAIKLFRVNGTLKSLQYIFKLIGWDVTVDYYWTLNPAAATNIRFLYNGAISYIEGNPATYTNVGNISPIGLSGLITGEEKIHTNGVYADIIDDSGNLYEKWSIVGEHYGVDADDVIPKLIKTPYIRIVVNQEDYDLFTGDYTDPDTGKVYSYTDTELFQITQEIINYFLETSRPVNVAIKEVSTPFKLTDTFTSVLDDPTFLIESVQASTAQYDGTLSYGMEIDRYSLGEIFGGFEYGTLTMNLIPSPVNVNITKTYGIGTSGTQRYIPTRNTATVDLTVPSDAVVRFYRSANSREKLSLGQTNYILMGTYTNVTNAIIEISNSFAVAINITTPSSIGDIVVDVTEKS